MPQNAFFLFLNDNRGKIRDKLEEEGVHLSGRSQSIEIAKRAGALWRDLKECEKRPYESAAALVRCGLKMENPVGKSEVEASAGDSADLPNCEDEECIEIEEIEYNGSSYYKDNTGNVYDYQAVEEKEELLVVGTLTAQGIEFSDSNTAVPVEVDNDIEEHKRVRNISCKCLHLFLTKLEEPTHSRELSIIETQLIEKQTDAEQLTERLRVSREDCERAKLALDEAKKFYERKMSENASIQVAIGLAKDSLKELTSSAEKLRKEVKREELELRKKAAEEAYKAQMAEFEREMKELA